MSTVTVDEAQEDIRALMKRAIKGEEIVIENGNEVVRLIPMRFDEQAARKKGYGYLKGRFKVEDKFFDELTDEDTGLQ